jgi:probable rRNA maturation factor
VTVLVSCDAGRGASAARRLRNRGRAYLEALGRAEAELSILITGDAGIRRLNRTWRKKDRATDVLSFPLSDPPGVGRVLGDVVISIDTAVRRGGRDARAVRIELDRYLAHGLLHLLGFDHERRGDAELMAAREEALVRGEGLVGAALKVKRRVRKGKGPRRRKKG